MTNSSLVIVQRVDISGRAAGKAKYDPHQKTLDPSPS